MVRCEYRHIFSPPAWGGQEWPPEHEAISPAERQLETSEYQTADLLSALAHDLLSTWEQTIRQEAIEKELLLVERRVGQLEESAALIVPVESLAPEPFAVLRSFHVVVRAQDDGYIATFFDANLSASGDTREEAVTNLKDIIVGVYRVLASHQQHELGPGPAKQLRVLRDFIAPRS